MNALQPQMFVQVNLPQQQQMQAQAQAQQQGTCTWCLYASADPIWHVCA
jgi:uncharacterized caspase-like protein